MSATGEAKASEEAAARCREEAKSQPNPTLKRMFETFADEYDQDAAACKRTAAMEPAEDEQGGV